MSAPRPSHLPVLALRREEAAQALGVSPDHFERHIAPGLTFVRVGALKLYRPDTLARWLGTQESDPATEIRERRRRVA